jgi:hypothetical protein
MEDSLWSLYVVLYFVGRGLVMSWSLIEGVVLYVIKTDQETIKVQENCISTEKFLEKNSPYDEYEKENVTLHLA